MANCREIIFWAFSSLSSGRLIVENCLVSLGSSEVLPAVAQANITKSSMVQCSFLFCRLCRPDTSDSCRRYSWAVGGCVWGVCGEWRSSISQLSFL